MTPQNLSKSSQKSKLNLICESHPVKTLIFYLSKDGFQYHSQSIGAYRHHITLHHIPEVPLSELSNKT
jgi:hypothetical protein